MSHTTFPLLKKNVLLVMLAVAAVGYSLVRFLIDLLTVIWLKWLAIG